VLHTLFSPVSIIPPLLHSHFHVDAIFFRETDGQNLGTFEKKPIALWNIMKALSFRLQPVHSHYVT
jgi:hypothetical protein